MKYHERLRAIRRSPSIAYQLLVNGRYDFTYDQMPISVRGMAWPKRINLIRSGLNLLHRRLKPWNNPLHMQFELTSFCNLHCPVCPTGTGELNRRTRAMDVELFRKVYDEVAPHLLTASLWGWGESILHPALGDILRIADRHDAVTFLSTNGQHLQRDAIMQAILEFPPSYLIVAIDGLTDETNTKFRVGAKLEPILRAVRQLAEQKKRRNLHLPVLHMRFMVMKHNEHEVPAAASFAADHGFDMLTLRTLSIIDSDTAVETHSKMIPKSQDFRAYQYSQNERIRKSDYVCMQPFWFPSLFTDGRLVACEQDFNATQASGKISEDLSFTDLWHSDAAISARKIVRDTPEKNSHCRNCPAWDRSMTDTSLSATFFDHKIANPLTVGKDKRA
jgi:radical SAM protein with 4Fe4S-binding SPASM domain